MTPLQESPIRVYSSHYKVCIISSQIALKVSTFRLVFVSKGLYCETPKRSKSQHCMSHSGLKGLLLNAPCLNAEACIEFFVGHLPRCTNPDPRRPTTVVGSSIVCDSSHDRALRINALPRKQLSCNSCYFLKLPWPGDTAKKGQEKSKWRRNRP